MIQTQNKSNKQEANHEQFSVEIKASHKIK